MSSNNPILNNPYEEPIAHYATNLDGELDYEKVVPGRRVFTPEIQSVPVRAGAQASLLEVNDAAADYGDLLVNLARHEVKQWRLASYPNTTRVTKELLTYWFLNPERENRLFFAQREAIETAIWLNEVADRSNPGQHILSRLAKAQHVNGDAAANLPRIAFKMATGAGKTVVMAALIAYHFCNRQEYRSDVRFADNFIAVAPGITIRDRLSVLCVQRETGTEGTGDYYSERLLVPPGDMRKNFASLNAHLAITNFHAFQPRTLQGNKRSPFDGKIGPTGEKTEALEDYAQIIKRLLPGFRPGSRLLILNDEAHHCYLPKQGDKRKEEGENTQEENARAAVWFRGLVELARRFKVRAVYDLSATPYYLTGSGYDPYSLFPWVVSDFGLTEAIESGLVKIPFLPTSDDTDKIKEPVLRNLYEHVREGLSKAGQRTKRARASAEGEKFKEAPPHLPPTLQSALDQFYRHYEEDFNRPGQQTFEAPPVFIVVCNNTSVSKEVFKFMAGYEQSAASGDAAPEVVTGRYELFSNFNPQTLKPLARPPTLLIDSDALENSGQIDEGFKRVFAAEIEQFKADYRVIHGAAAAEDISDAEILREIVNNVGKRGTLGAHIRCVVSVSMLTEGWDANTVTHVVGIRKFGSQLLCEQVAGRALRRKSYQLAAYDPDSGALLSDAAVVRRKRDAQRARQAPRIHWKFPPEYAHIIGVPFRQFKPGSATPPPVQPTTRVHPLDERTGRYEIVFPNLDGYRIEYPEGALKADFSAVPDYEIPGNEIPTHTVLENAFAADKVKLSLDDLLALRDQPIIFRITKDLIRDHFSDDPAAPAFHRFAELHAIVAEWYHTKVRVLGKGPEWKKLLYYADPKKLVAAVAKGIATGQPGEPAVRAIVNFHNPSGSTRFAHGNTSRETYATRHSHVNVVVIDSGWEGQAAKVLDDLAEEGRIETWVKNHFLQFRIPYVDDEGESRDYLPDFIVRTRDPDGTAHHLIVEVTGARRDKPAKVWTAAERWVPAVNALPASRGFGRWDFLELAGQTQVADFRNILLKWLDAPADSKPRVRADVWSLRREVEATEGPLTEDIDLPERKSGVPGFGVWKSKGVDGLTYQERLRKEWER
ncbi:MAG: DEAD/DEAH box helicase family protein [Opitutaceae bacterium]|nr:DEAD/DEAH box helicase family protein [Opitutaceae bacterium]